MSEAKESINSLVKQNDTAALSAEKPNSGQLLYVLPWDSKCQLHLQPWIGLSLAIWKP